MEERRASQRHAFHLRTNVIQKEGDGNFHLLRPNIGFGGIGGFGPNLVAPGSDLSVRFTFPQRSGEDKQEVVSGKVVWAHRDGNFNALGIAFDALSREMHPQLFSYLQYADQFE